MPRGSSFETIAGIAAAAIFALIGVALLVLGAHLYLERAALVAGGTRTSGMIVGFERVGGPLGPDTLQETILVPEVRFDTLSGEQITFLGSTDTKPPWANYENGRTVSVVYDPERPDEARIDTFAEIWFAPFLLWLIGAGAVFIPPFAMWRHLRTGATAGR